MLKRKLQFEVVPESAYTDFSDRYEKKSGISNGALITAATAATASLATYAITLPKTISTTIPATITPILEPLNVLAQMPSTLPVNFVATPEMIQTGFLAEGSMTVLANVLDPLIQLLTVISLPIASVIMVGSCFYFLLGNSEKAWQGIFNSALGYILIQMSPLFLKILQEIGKAV